MIWDVLAVHLALAAAIFLILNWVGMHSASLGYISLGVLLRRDEAPAFNFIFRSLGPVIVVVLAAAVLFIVDGERYVANIWLATIYYFVGRLLFNVALGRWRLINWKREILLSSTSVLVALFIYDQFLRHKQLLFPDVQTMANEFWLLVILFVYATLNKLHVSQEGSKRRKDSYLDEAYRDASRRYGEVISKATADRFAESLIYAILLFESFNRPALARFLERLFHPFGAKTLGPLQVTTDVIISDHQSVELGVGRLVKSYEAVRSKAQALTASKGKALDLVNNRHHRQYIQHHVAASYNRDDQYVSAVAEMHENLLERFYPGMLPAVGRTDMTEFYLTAF